MLLLHIPLKSENFDQKKILKGAKKKKKNLLTSIVFHSTPLGPSSGPCKVPNLLHHRRLEVERMEVFADRINIFSEALRIH